MNKYEQDLLQRCSQLDAVTNSAGKITNCAQAIIASQDKAPTSLCKFIEKASELKDPKITQLAIATKDALIGFYGYQQITKLLLQTEVEEDQCS